MATDFPGNLSNLVGITKFGYFPTVNHSIFRPEAFSEILEDAPPILQGINMITQSIPYSYRFYINNNYLDQLLGTVYPNSLTQVQPLI